MKMIDRCKLAVANFERMADLLAQLPVTADGEVVVPGMTVYVVSHESHGDTGMHYRPLEVWGITKGNCFSDGEFTINCEDNDYGEKELYAGCGNVPGVTVHPKLRE